ncbi:MAG: hypothetical protein H6740_27785 [Alphaproteobacteria bacterium]|nr:hypothetical protein [Alphaproteobacteria bacterium]
MLLLLLLLSSAIAAELRVIAPDGDPVPGRSARLLLVLFDGDAPVEAAPEALEISAGSLDAPSPGPAPGTWWLAYQLPADAPEQATLRVKLEGAWLQSRLPLGRLPGSSLTGPDGVRAVVGQAEPVRLLITGQDGLQPEHLQLSAPEGRFLEPTLEEGGVVVRWVPGQAREPRAVPIAVRDGRRQDAPPHWVTVSLVSRAPIAVSTEPGTRMSVTISGRLYGPVVAGADGQASVSVEVRPGERIGEAVLEDALGNRQRNSLTLLREPRPSLVMLAEGPVVDGAPLPRMHLRALGPAGRPWIGAPPGCATGGGAEMAVSVTEAGVYVATLPEDLEQVGAIRVDCVLDEGAAAVSERLPQREGLPARVGLTVWPEELSGDLPVAQIRAWLEDADGEPLPPEGLVLSAGKGQIVRVERGDLALRADLEVVPDAGEEQVLAAWTAPTASGLPGDVRVGVGEGLQLRVVDRLGLPLEGVPLRVRVDGEALGEVLSDARGYAALPALGPGGVRMIEVRAPGLMRRALVTPWWAPPALDPAAADLSASKLVRVKAGRVSKVSVSATPAVIYTGAGATGWVTVRLLDRSGVAVTDEPVRIEVSEGRVEPLEVRADGSLRASYHPPDGVSQGTVEVRVLSGSGAFPETSTRIELEPRPISWAPGLAAGVITTFGQQTTFHAAAQVDRAVPFLADRQVYGRLSVGYHQVSTETTDEGRNEEIGLRMDLVPISLSALLRRDLGTWAGWTGAGLTVTPYRLELRYEGETAVSGLGLHRPGPMLYVGGGYRLSNGEVFGELRGLSILSRAEDAGYDGQVGGLVFLVGYRVLY